MLATATSRSTSPNTATVDLKNSDGRSISSHIDCSTVEPACTQQIDVRQRCSAEFHSDFDRNIYCWCTESLQEKEDRCWDCSSRAGLYTRDPELKSFDDDSSLCASASVRYGNATSTPEGYYTLPSTTSGAIPTTYPLSDLVAASPTTVTATGTMEAGAPSSASVACYGQDSVKLCLLLWALLLITPKICS